MKTYFNFGRLLQLLHLKEKGSVEVESYIRENKWDKAAALLLRLLSRDDKFKLYRLFLLAPVTGRNDDAFYSAYSKVFSRLWADYGHWRDVGFTAEQARAGALVQETINHAGNSGRVLQCLHYYR